MLVIYTGITIAGTRAGQTHLLFYCPVLFMFLRALPSSSADTMFNGIPDSPKATLPIPTYACQQRHHNQVSNLNFNSHFNLMLLLRSLIQLTQHPQS